MREVPAGRWMHHMHSTGGPCSSAYFFRGMLYGSYRKPRELLWIGGVVIFLTVMAECFLGYLIP